MILEQARIGEQAFSDPLSELEIDVFFTLSPAEIAAVCDRRGELNRLGLALHLCVVKMTDRAELSTKLVPQAVLVHVADQLDLPPPDLASLRSLYRDRSTLFRHRKPAVELAGFREVGAGARSGLLQYLRQEVLATTAPDVLRARSCDGCMRGSMLCSRPATFAVLSGVRRTDGTRRWLGRSTVKQDRCRTSELSVWPPILNRA